MNTSLLKYIFLSLIPLITSLVTVTLDLRHVSLTLFALYFLCYLPQSYLLLCSLIIAGVIEDVLFQTILGSTSLLFLALSLTQKALLSMIVKTENFWLFWGHFVLTLGTAIALKVWLTLPHTVMMREGIVALFMMGAFPIFYKKMLALLHERS